MLPLHTLRRAVVRYALPVSRWIAEATALGPLAPLRRLSRRLFRSEIALIEPHLDRDFYLRQVSCPSSRARAARDPALHYVSIGRFRSFAPNPDFDPDFYREDNPDIGWAADPLRHYALRPSDAAIRTADWAGAGLREAGGQAGTIVTLNHGRGGGSTHFLSLYENALRAQGIRIVRMARCSARAPLFRAVDVAQARPFGPVLHLLEDEAAFAAALRGLGASRLVVNHTIDLPPAAFEALPRICKAAGIPFDTILHDYYLVCQRIDLVDHTQRYCGIADVERCRACLRDGAMSVRGAIDPAQWRAMAMAFLREAARIVVPSEDTQRRLAPHCPGLELRVWRPEDDAALPASLRRAPRPGEALRIAVLGRLNVPKGFDVVHRLARTIRTDGLPLKLIAIGSTLDDFALRRAGVTVTGRYREADLDALIAAHDPHAGFVPAIWPETWSFVLTALLRHRLHVTAFDIGAVADRLRATGGGSILPYELADDTAALARHFMALRELPRSSPALRSEVA